MIILPPSAVTLLKGYYTKGNRTSIRLRRGVETVLAVSPCGNTKICQNLLHIFLSILIYLQGLFERNAVGLKNIFFSNDRKYFVADLVEHQLWEERVVSTCFYVTENFTPFTNYHNIKFGTFGMISFEISEKFNFRKLHARNIKSFKFLFC